MSESDLGSLAANGQDDARRDYYTVRVADGISLRNVSKVLFYDHQKGNLHVGPSMRLTGPGGRVQLESRALAEQFMECALTRLRARHGDTLLLAVDTGTAPSHISGRRTAVHSALVRQVLEG